MRLRSFGPLIPLLSCMILGGCGDDEEDDFDPVSPVGACYDTEGVCRLTEEDPCLDSGGIYDGDDSDCEVAGPNAGGVLLVHYAPNLSTFSDAPCDSLAVTDCAEVVVDGEVTGRETVVVFILAAFPESAAPSVAGAAFGIEYTGTTVIDWGHCGWFDLPGENWPASGEGLVVTFEEPRSTTILPLCWLAVEVETGSRIAAIAHPQLGGVIADPSVPTVDDSVRRFGELGFGAAGRRVCPGE